MANDAQFIEKWPYDERMPNDVQFIEKWPNDEIRQTDIRHSGLVIH